MSVSGIFSSSFGNNQISSQNRLTNSQFQQLGQDLASGNLSSAQSDFAILQQAFMQPGSTASTSPASSTSNPLARAFQQLSSDLKSGNLTAAQTDYSTIQQDMKSQFSGHHHHHFGNGFEPLNMVNSQTNQDVTSTLAQSNTSSAQNTYASLAQQLQQYALGDASGPAGVTALANPISFMA